MKEILKAGGIVLPAPVSITVNDELIWTADTGRLMDGTMAGDVVAEKKTVSIKWGIMPETDIVKIKSGIIIGFFPVTFRDDGVELTIETYRGTLSKEHLGYIGDGIYWYRSASVDLIER
ncbi:hypothetical protein A8806_110168 [Faecalicatena orotica]|uniref:Uncharacterized protein n=1 Tax=Faecalicatena orotica TaxID=1544 RepID=A0A2Y9BJH0_9FIRM|nr:hypothetical protein [Faecalicatena orotica]PWJ27993.1 hypothetical protein A8806_110168 [Faecalicatena orotica]SSA57016.1 hypothetical protein SAMN05216536_110168 [Faecalicatena orotica]